MKRSSISTGFYLSVFAYALFWGGMSTIMSSISPQDFPTRATAVLTSILGVIVMGLGFGVFRRKQFAAWTLTAYAAIDVGQLLLSHVGDYRFYILPGLLFWGALVAAVALHREAQAPATQN